jgi:hypothetical protein
MLYLHCLWDYDECEKLLTVAVGLTECFIGEIDRCVNRKICGKLSVNETLETPLTSTSFSVDCFEFETGGMSNKLLRIESATKYKHHMQVKIGYCYKDKEIRRWRN